MSFQLIAVFAVVAALALALGISLRWNTRQKKRAQLIASRDSALSMLYSKSPLSEAEYFRRRVELARQVH
jgi:hypothetical protein